MRRARCLISGLVPGLLIGILGCSELPTGSEPFPEAPPAEGPVFTHAGSTLELEALTWTNPLRSDLTVSRRIGENGGVIRIPRVGVSVHFPEGALEEADEADEADDDDADAQGASGGDGDGRTRITLTAHAGDAVALGFGPHGLVFHRPVVVSVDLEGTSAHEDPSILDGLVAVYFEGEPSGEVEALERLPVEVADGKLVFRIAHFSGYMLAGG